MSTINNITSTNINNNNSNQNNNEYINPFEEKTPNHNNSHISQFNYSGLSTPLSKISYANSLLNSKSNGLIQVKEITDQETLNQKFNQCENQISSICHHYVSMKNIFNQSSIHMKNEILNYLGSYRLSAQTSINNITNNCYIATKNFEEINSLKQIIDKNKKEIENLIQKNLDYKNENDKKYSIQYDEIKKLNKTIKQLTKNIDDKEKELDQYKVQLVFLREQIGKIDNNQDVISIDYYLEAPKNINNNLSMKEVEISNIKMEYEKLKEKNNRAEYNFNYFVKLLTNTCNNALLKFKELYKKIEGKEWVNEFQACEHFYEYNCYNISEDFSWTYISNMLDTINDLIGSSFGLINKPLVCKISEKLNGESYYFLVQHLISLNKIIKIQKELIVIQNSILNSDSFIIIKNEVNGLKNYINNYEQFLTNQNEILKKEQFYTEIKDLFTKEKMENSYYEDYLNEIKKNFNLTKEFMIKMENDFIKNNSLIGNENIGNIKSEIIKINKEQNFIKENKNEIYRTYMKKNLVENNNNFYNDNQKENSANNRPSAMSRLTLSNMIFNDDTN